MSDQESKSNPATAGGSDKNRTIVDRLVFAALTEQRRARRWRVFFMLFFAVYLSVVTLVLMLDSGGSGPGSKADGDKHTALVRLSGLIAPGEDAGAENIIAGLRAAFEHGDTAGILLEINSPGGSPVQSAYIYDEIRRLKQKYESIPVYAVIEDVAASGAYFVAAATDKIYTNKSSLVGSIGVRMDSFGFVEMMKKMGIERRLLTAGENKGLLDPFLPERSDERIHLQSMLDEVHRHFIDAVKQGRGDRLQDSEELYTGLIWSGERALSLGLVDAYGNRYSVARDIGAEEIIDFTPETDLLSRIADRIGASAGRSIGEYLGGGLKLN